jgi:hypothetical protein
MLLDPDPHSQYGSGCRTAKSMRIQIYNTKKAPKIDWYNVPPLPYPPPPTGNVHVMAYTCYERHSKVPYRIGNLQWNKFQAKENPVDCFSLFVLNTIERKNPLF